MATILLSNFRLFRYRKMTLPSQSWTVHGGWELEVSSALKGSYLLLLQRALYDEHTNKYLHGRHEEKSGAETWEKILFPEVVRREKGTVSLKRDQGRLSGRKDIWVGSEMINRMHSTEMRELICLLPLSSTSTPLQSFSLKELSLQRELKHTRVSMTDCLMRYFCQRTQRRQRVSSA